MSDETSAAADLPAAYKHVREIQRNLHTILAEGLTKKALEATAKQLGFWKKGKLAIESEEQIALLMDFGIYEYRPDSRSAVERYALHHGAALDEDQRRVLDAMARARFTLLELRRAQGPVTLAAYDLLYEEELVIADEALAARGENGLVLAGRVVPFGAFSIVSGAALVIHAEVADAFVAIVRRGAPLGLRESMRALMPGRRTKLSLRIIEAALGDPDEILGSLPEDLRGG